MVNVVARLQVEIQYLLAAWKLVGFAWTRLAAMYICSIEFDEKMQGSRSPLMYIGMSYQFFYSITYYLF